MSEILIPDNLSFYTWSNSLRQSLPALNVPMPNKTAKNWWVWAYLFLAINNLGFLPLPDKAMFPKEEDWRKWAWLFLKTYPPS